MNFVGRSFELNYLNQLYHRAGGSFCVVYGRRRIGKTRLLTHWLETNQLPGFYWLATDSSSASLLRSLSHMVYQEQHKEPPAAPEFSYFDWDELFRELVRLVDASERKIVIVLDEFTYAINAYPDLPNKLQAVWDHKLKDRSVMLVLSGSHVGMMEDEVLAQRSPLYGRATGRLKLRQLSFCDVRTLFPTYDIESCVALYSVLGGVPYYLEHLDPSLSLVENIVQRIIGSPSLVQDEPRLLLHDHFSNPGLYAAIIAQVAQSVHSPKEIGKAIDVEPATVSGYLSTLVRLGLLERTVPVTERHPERSRRGRYHVVDSFLRFYYRFLAPQLPFIVRGSYTAVWNTIERHWRAFVGTYTYEELCREWVYIAAETGQLPFLPQVVGSHWSQSEQLDVVAINWDERTALYGECKWKRESKFTLSEAEKLVRQSAQLGIANNKGQPIQSYYVFFSRSGFTQPAIDYAAEINAMLIDLDGLDETLAKAIR